MSTSHVGWCIVHCMRIAIDISILVQYLLDSLVQYVSTQKAMEECFCYSLVMLPDGSH